MKNGISYSLYYIFILFIFISINMIRYNINIRINKYNNSNISIASLAFDFIKAFINSKGVIKGSYAFYKNLLFCSDNILIII